MLFFLTMFLIGKSSSQFLFVIRYNTQQNIPFVLILELLEVVKHWYLTGPDTYLLNKWLKDYFCPMK